MNHFSVVALYFYPFAAALLFAYLASFAFDLSIITKTVPDCKVWDKRGDTTFGRKPYLNQINVKTTNVNSNWGQEKNTFVFVEAGGEKNCDREARKKFFWAIFRGLLSCFNPSLTLECKTLFLLTKVDLFYYKVP